MPINPDAVGQESDPVSTSWTSKDALLYAVGIGAGTDELAFTTENTAKRRPAGVPDVRGGARLGPGRARCAGIGSFNPAMLVHGEQRVTLHKPIPPDGSATLKAKLVGIYDKGKAAVVASETTATDDADGSPLYTLYSSAFIRGEGGWGGDRGPSGPRNVAPERAADHAVTYQTSPDQALVYRLSGDRNPLHSDPAFAAMGGFDRPILHGLCTYGFTGRALLHTLCGSDPARFQHVEGRFSSPVLPGDALTINMWDTGAGEAVFTTSKQDGTVVIDQGALRYTA